MRRYIPRVRACRSWLVVGAVIAFGAVVTALVVWAPASGPLLTMHMATRHVLSWLHDHWLNAPAITAGATILLVIVGLGPLYIWRRDRAGRDARPDETARDMEAYSGHPVEVQANYR
jgi:hypothetical protein